MRAKRIKSLEKRIAERIARVKADVFVRDDFKGLGGYDQVGRGLRRLAAKGQIIKIWYGLYARATVSPLSGKTVPKKPLSRTSRRAVFALTRMTSTRAKPLSYVWRC